jgi:ubiquinone/menaquinone biosynthesis C-methylase UbiE
MTPGKKNPMQADDGITPMYVCPRTQAPLRLDGDVLRAEAHDIVYPLRAGMPQFLRFGPAEDDRTFAQLERLNRLARENGWRPALRAVYGDNDGFIRYVTDAERASFIELLPLTPDTDVLEIGPGLGQFTALLARRAKSVCALEVVAGQAEFAAERCRQEGMTNVHLAVGGDDCRLPYGDTTFDLVVLNLVFEWCGSRSLEETHSDVQRRLLAEMCRVLKPGGSLYLATKNRFALRYLIGKTDEHCYNLRFGSALPRWFAQLLLRLRGHTRTPGKLYSHRTLKAMLSDAGFEKIDSFWATPEMRNPTHYVRTDAASIRQARRTPGFVQGEMRSTKLLMPLIPAFLVKYFTPGLAFLATKRR